MKHNWSYCIAIVLGIGVWLILVLQYPLATTFPIGGDATRNILSAEQTLAAFDNSSIEGFRELDRNSNYPAAILVVAGSKLLPLAWPERWIWLMVGAHTLTAGVLGMLINRLAGKRAAAFGIAAWGIVGMGYTWHVIDATFAQLLSLPLLLVVLWCWWERRWLTGTMLLVLLYFTHPLSAIIAVGTALWVTGIAQTLRLPPQRHLLFLGISILLGVIVSYLFFDTVAPIMATFEPEEAGVSVHDLLASPAGPLVLIAPLGWLVLARRQHPAAPWLSSFLLLSTLLFFGFRFANASAFLVRWQSYFSLAVTPLAAIGLEHLVGNLWPRRQLLQFAVPFLLLGGLALQTWQANTRVFAFFESPSRYERVHATELEAIAWLDQHLPPGSVIASTTINRHSEWIPILSQHQWIGVPSDNPLFAYSGEKLMTYLPTQPFTHVIFFTKREKPSEAMTAYHNFETIYQNPGVVLIDLKTYVP